MSKSITLSKLLDTRKTSEQVERVENLIRIANNVPAAVTVLAVRGQVLIDVVAPTQVSSSEVKAILNQAIEQLTRMEVEQEMSQAAMAQPAAPTDDEVGQDQPDPAVEDLPFVPVAGEVSENGDITP